MVDLGSLGGYSSAAHAVNDNGQVAGDSTTASGDTHAFTWTQAGGMVDLGTLGGPDSSVRAVNDNGQVVGDSTTASGDTHAFSWTQAGGMVDLGTLGGPDSEVGGRVNLQEPPDPGYSLAHAVNDNGQIVGWSYTASGSRHAFSWTQAGGMVDLGTLGGQFSLAFAVNDNGQVVGYSGTANGIQHAFSWTQAGGLVDLGGFGGAESQAYAVNDNGQVVGRSTTTVGDWHAALWTTKVAVQGRVIQSVPHVSTDPSIVATFTDTNTSSTASQYHVTVGWGDGTTSSTSSGSLTVASAPAFECTYLGVPISGQCFVVRGIHIYLNAGTYRYIVSVAFEAEPTVSGTGVAEIQGSAPSLSKVKNMIGIVHLEFPGGGTFNCTAPVVATPTENVIATSEHCGTDRANYIEFAPGHSGTCLKIYRLSQCAPGTPDKPFFGASKQNPYGIWTGPGGSSVFWAGSPPYNGPDDPLNGITGSHDYAFIVLQPNSAGVNVQHAVGALPIHFFYSAPPTNQIWSGYAYAADLDPSPTNQYPPPQNLQTCQKAPAAKGITSPPEEMVIKCDYGYNAKSTGRVGCYGCSGGPWVNSANGLPEAIGAMNEWQNDPNLQYGMTFGKDATQVFIRAVSSAAPG
jgi:probable HAF family extracellular repeat protein